MARKIPIDLNARPLSYSSLKHFRKSPKHYVEYVLGDRIFKEEWNLGTAFEIALTEPQNYDKKVFVYTKPNLRSNAGKEEWELMKTQGRGKTMITEDCGS